MQAPGLACAVALLLAVAAPDRAGSAAEPAAGSSPAADPARAARFADHEVWSHALAQTKAAVAAGDLPTAEARALAMLREAAHFTFDDPRIRDTLDALMGLVEREWIAGSYPRFAEEVLEMLEREADPAHPLALAQILNLAAYKHDRGEHASASALLEEVRTRTAGDVANARTWVSATLGLVEIETALGRPERAERLAVEARELAIRAFGPGSPQEFLALFAQSLAERALGKFDAAERHLREALEIAPAGEPDHPKVAQVHLDRGALLLRLCRHDEGRSEIQTAVDALVASVGGADPLVVKALIMLAVAEEMRGDLPAARRAAERALAAAEQHSARAGGDPRRAQVTLAETHTLLASIDLSMGRSADAKARLVRVRSLRKPIGAGEDDARIGASLAVAEASLGNASEAARLAEAALAQADSGRLSAMYAAEVRVDVADALVRLGDPRAEAVASRASAMLEREDAPAHRRLRALRVLALAQAGADRGEAALDTLWQARSLGVACFGAGSPLLEVVARQEAAVLAALGRGGEASAASGQAEAIAQLSQQRAGAPDPHPRRIEDAELNFAFRTPPPPWSPIAPDRDGVAPLHVFGRAEPSMRFEMYAQDTGASADLRDEEVLARTLDRIGPPAPGVERLISRKERSIHGIVGVQIVKRVSDGKTTWYAVEWLGGRAGILYRLSLRSGKTTLDALTVEAQALFEGLSVLDPTRVSSPLAAAQSFRSERFGYSLDLAGTGFVMLERRAWPEGVEFAAKLPDVDLRVATLLVIPVSLSGIDADPDRVDAALCLMVDPEMAGWRSRTASDASGGGDREYEATRSVGAGTLSARVRVLRRGDVAVAVGVLVRGGSKEAAAALLDATARVELPEAAPAPARQEPTERERAREDLFLGALGLAYARVERYAEAIPLFERIVQRSPDDAMTARHLAEVRFRAGRVRDSVDGLDRALVRFPSDPVLLGWRGLGRAMLGEDEAAAGDLRRSIELGNASEEVLAAYVLALVRTERVDEALDELARRIEQTNSAAARVLRTAVLRRAGRMEEAIAELRELSREHPSDLAIHGAMAEAAIDAGDPEAFLEATEELARSDGEPGVLVLYLRALAQQSLGRRSDAIASLDRALERAPDSVEIRALRDALGTGDPEGPGI